MFRKIICLGLILNFVACSNSAAKKDTLAVAIKAQPLTLDSRIATDEVGLQMARLIFNGLMRLNESLELVGDLAESYEQVSPTVYRFKLRKGVKFHHGRELTVKDVMYTFNSIKEGKVKTAFSGDFKKYLKKMVPEGPYVLRLELNEPYAPFLTSMIIGIVPAELAEEAGEAFSRSPVGTGIYRFVSWDEDAIIELAANEEYYGEKARTAKLKFHIIKDDNIRVLKLIKGDIDLTLNGVPAQLLAKVKADPKLKVDTATGVNVAYLGTNAKDAILQNVKVRQAIAHAINRDELIKHRRQGLASKANSILAPANWAYNKDIAQVEFNPVRAKRLLDEAGFVDPDGDGPQKRFTLSYKTSTNKERVAIARSIAAQLELIGIGVDVQTFEWGKFYGDVKSGNFQLYSLTWVGVTSPDILYSVYHSSQLPPNGVNRGRYTNTAVDKQVEIARANAARVTRLEAYKKAQKFVLEELPVIPLWYEDNIVVYRNNLEGVGLRADASYKPFRDIAKK